MSSRGKGAQTTKEATGKGRTTVDTENCAGVMNIMDCSFLLGGNGCMVRIAPMSVSRMLRSCDEANVRWPTAVNELAIGGMPGNAGCVNSQHRTLPL